MKETEEDAQREMCSNTEGEKRPHTAIQVQLKTGAGASHKRPQIPGRELKCYAPSSSPAWQDNEGGRKLPWELAPSFPIRWSPRSERQLDSPLSTVTDSPNPKHHMPHLLGHHGSWGPQPLLWRIIIVRVI